MPISDTRWKQFGDSRFPWERDALDFLRAGLPDHEPFRAWALLEFIAAIISRKAAEGGW